MYLSQAQNSKKYTILNVSAKGIMLNKLLDMGFIKGALVEVVRYAPLKDPIELRIYDYLISLRVSEANLIEVEPI